MKNEVAFSSFKHSFLHCFIRYFDNFYIHEHFLVGPIQTGIIFGPQTTSTIPTRWRRFPRIDDLLLSTTKSVTDQLPSNWHVRLGSHVVQSHTKPSGTRITSSHNEDSTNILTAAIRPTPRRRS